MLRFSDETKEMHEVSSFETSSVLDETGIFMNVSIGGANGGQMNTYLLLKRHQALPNRLNQI